MKSLLHIFKRKVPSIEYRLKIIKQGNEGERERFISEYIPFIIKTITKVTNRYIEVENNDEYIVGLEAFNEAIDRYEFDKGNFIKYAETVIRSRIIDFMRKETKSKSLISIDDNENLSESQYVTEEDNFTDTYDMKEQMLKFKLKLKEFDITFEELVQESPKHWDTRLNSIRIARVIVEDEDIKEEFFRKKVLPAKKIMKKANVSRKVLKGNRKFIIATALILDSNLDLLKDYVSGVERREEKSGI